MRNNGRTSIKYKVLHFFYALTYNDIIKFKTTFFNFLNGVFVAFVFFFFIFIVLPNLTFY